ncbi:MAG: Flp/Fap pilin component [Pseudomonadota bacterium]|jgi:pilus assembly protein Flp/PilA
MSQLIKSVQAFWADEEGATAIEYGLLASLIAVAIITPLGLVRTELVAIFTAIAGAL